MSPAPSAAGDRCRVCGGPLSPTSQAIASLASMGVMLLPGREEREAHGYCSKTCEQRDVTRGAA